MIFLLSTLGMMYAVDKTGEPLKTVETPHKIVDLELASSKESINRIISVWQNHNTIGDAKINIYWDFLFLLSYSGLFYMACLGLTGFYPQRLFNASAGIFMAKISLLAGFLDILENILMLQSLDGKLSDFSATLTASFAVVKFSLVGLISCYLIVLIFNFGYRKLFK